MSVRKILKKVQSIAPTASIDAVLTHFQNDSKLKFLPVFDGIKLLGLIERSHFFEYKSALLEEKTNKNNSIQPIISRCKLAFEIETPIQKIASEFARQMQDDEKICAIIFDEGHYRGIINSTDVFKLIANLTEVQARAFEMAKNKAFAARQAKADFLSTISHEIRTPLNGILGMSQILAKSDLPEKEKSMAATIFESGNFLLQILDDILDMSCIEVGKLTLNPVQMDLRPLLEYSAGLMKSRALSKELDFQIDFSQIEDGKYACDEKRLKQVILNLLSNAIKFTSFGSVAISAKSRKLNMNYSELEVKISDTGAGMSEEFLQKLFLPFEQADNSISRLFGGTGLGLSIVHSVVKLMGGEIKVESALDVGTCFTIRVPLENAEACLPEACDFDIPIKHDAGLRILVAEDNPTNVAVMRALFGEMGFDMFFARDGREAISIFQQSRFDLILMDIQMPIMDGLAATKMIRQIEKASRKVPTPIIALSANSMDHNIREALNAGADAHEAKPIILGRLISTMEKVLDEYQEYQYQKIAV